MNWINLALAVLTIAPIVLSMLLGLLRGSRRAFLRLILVLLCAVGAFLLCGLLVNVVLEIDISAIVKQDEAVTVQQYLQQLFGEKLESLVDYTLPLVQCLVKVVLFWVLFLLLRILTWLIVYPLCKLFVKPKVVKTEDGKRKARYHGLLGSVIGLVQGVAIALCVCFVFHGLVVQGGNILTAIDGFEIAADSSSDKGEAVALVQTREAEDSSNGGAGLSNLDDIKSMIDEYLGSSLGTFYNNVSSKPFDFLSKVKTEDDREVTLSGQVEAFCGLAEIGKELVKINDINFMNFYAKGNIDVLVEVLDSVQNIRDGLSDEAKITVFGMVSALGEAFDVDMSLLNDFANLDFAAFSKTFDKLNSYKKMNASDITHEDAKDIILSLAESDALIDLLTSKSNVDLGRNLGAKQTAEVQSSINELLAANEISAETAATMRKIFGLSA